MDLLGTEGARLLHFNFIEEGRIYTLIGGLLAYLEVLRYIHQGNFERQVSNRTAADSKRQDPNPSAYSQRMNFPPLRLVDFLRYSIRWHVRSHTKERLNGQSLMNSFSNHYWNIAYRKSSLKEVAMLEGHFFPAYLSSALDLCLGSLIATSYTLPCLDGVPAGEACRRRLAATLPVP
ncbi:BnaC03g56650D [Brassica napus]|uniref:BnaC03g56650D protein n=1 Tax=Brassica napus TaxID=3708 RepID=A0A078H7U1_BRANA|nr:BnaC03g56650D [Brassica napus]